MGSLSTDLFSFYDPSMGSCVMFNHAKSKKLFAARSLGPMGGEFPLSFQNSLASFSRSRSVPQSEPVVLLSIDRDGSHLRLHS